MRPQILTGCVILRLHQYSNMATYGYDAKLDDTHTAGVFPNVGERKREAF